MNGNQKIYNALTFEVTCTITSFTAPSAPTSPPFTLAYTVFEPAISIDVSTLVYVQDPPCGYAYSSTYTWVNLPANGFIQEPVAGSGDLFVVSENSGDAGTHTPGFTNVIDLASNGPAGSLQFSVATQVDFSIVVTDPCLVVTLDAVVMQDAGNANNVVSTYTMTDGTKNTDTGDLNI